MEFVHFFVMNINLYYSFIGNECVYLLVCVCVCVVLCVFEMCLIAVVVVVLVLLLPHPQFFLPCVFIMNVIL